MSDEQQLAVPDIKNGFIVNGYESANRWQTSIESCLIKVEDGEESTAYLSTQCRAEYVSPQGIFSPSYYEYALAHTWHGPIVMRSGPAIYRLFQGKASESRRYAAVNMEREICAPKVLAQTIEFDDLLDKLQSDNNHRDNFIYMQVEWIIGDVSYKLICPCRYTNFPHPKQNDERYIQPISGNVLVENENRFYLAYVSTHVRANGAERTELILKDRVSLFRLKHWTLYRRRTKPFVLLAHWFIRLVTVPFSLFFITDEYWRVLSLDAKCTFFTYNEN